MPGTATDLTPLQRRLLTHLAFLAGASGGYVALDPMSLKEQVGARKYTIDDHLDILAELGHLRIVSIVRDGPRRVYVCAVPAQRDGGAHG